MKSIWYITRKFPPSRGGMQQLSARIAGEVSALRPLTLVRWGRGQWGLPLFLLWALLRLSVGLLRGRVRVLLLGDPVLSVLALPARWCGVPVAVVVHGLDIAYARRGYPAYLRRCFWGRFDLYFGISRYVLDALARGGIDPARCALVHPGVAAAAVAPDAPPDQAPRLLILGRLVRRKGALWFVEAVMPLLPDTVALDIVGDGPDRAALERAIAGAGLQARVRLWGEVDDAEKARRLVACDLALMPNRRVDGDPEGFGLVALEAAMSGRYVLAADLEGLRDALADPALGRLLPEADARAWSGAILAELADRAALRERGRAARAYAAAHCSWRGMGRRYAERLDALG
ncbi:glycosyltransferase family 4 protein [Lysobacter sp. K5869]|uniref:glycosyltransferase family 4 protein n=1 Tax=Lysobacter sp. K5869 TaxID=2820808 RepID=UPI001C0637FF|nr:glycosyltransferase family 4 protein [Lysobacter sp. K5869]QWP77063.1 glycosyltransferase family 4 protein [Lysobacter sp. K5869]